MTLSWRDFLRTQHGYFGRVLGFRELKVLVGERKPPFSEEQKRRIEERWAEVKQKNPGAFSRPLLGLNDVVVDAARGLVTLGTYVTGYKEYSQTKSDLGENDRVWGTGAAGLTYVDDGGKRVFVFGERSKGTLSVGGSIESLPAGFTTEMDDSKGRNPFVATVINEAEEEIGIPKDRVQLVRYLGLARVRQWDKLYQDMHVDHLLRIQGASWGDVERAFEESNANKKADGKLVEHVRIIPVAEYELPAFVDQQRENLGIRTRVTLDSFFEVC